MSDTVEVTPVNFAVTRRLVLFWVGGGGEPLELGLRGGVWSNSRYLSQRPAQLPSLSPVGFRL